jgi:hypothetical protein
MSAKASARESESIPNKCRPRRVRPSLEEERGSVIARLSRGGTAFASAAAMRRKGIYAALFPPPNQNDFGTLAFTIR